MLLQGPDQIQKVETLIARYEEDEERRRKSDGGWRAVSFYGLEASKGGFCGIGWAIWGWEEIELGRMSFQPTAQSRRGKRARSLIF